MRSPIRLIALFVLVAILTSTIGISFAQLSGSPSFTATINDASDLGSSYKDLIDQLRGNLTGYLCLNASDLGNYDLNVDLSKLDLSGLTIQLLDANGTCISTTTTMADGKFKFSNVPYGFNYTMAVSRPGSDAGNFSVPIDFTNTTAMKMTDVNVAYSSEISGTVYQNTSGNGAYDPGEGRSGATVDIYGNNGTMIASTQTSPDGSYSFSGLGAGNYTVSASMAGKAGGSASKAVSLGVLSNETVDIALPSSYVDIHGTVFEDKNGNGISDNGEGIGSATVSLYDDNGDLVSTVTSAKEGTYSFPLLDDGVYLIEASANVNGKEVVGEDTATVNDGNNLTVNIDLSGASGNGTPVSTRTVISDSPSVVIEGVSFYVNGTVTTTSGLPVSDMIVTIAVERSNGSDQCVVGHGVVTDGTYSIECILPGDLGLGAYQIVASSEGNSMYQASNSDPSVQVMDDSQIFIDCPGEVVLDTQSNMTITLKESPSGEAIANAVLEVSLDGRTMKITTNSSGSATLAFELTSVGTQTLNVMFGGNNDTCSSSTEQKIAVEDISVDVLSGSLTRGQNNTVSILVQASDLAVSNRTVEVQFDGIDICSATTDSTGATSFDLDPGMSTSLGNNSLEFDVIGIHRVDQNISVLSRTSILLKLDGTTLNAELLDDHDNVLTGQQLELMDNDTGTWIGETSSSDLSFVIGGSVPAGYEVMFNGSEEYLPSSAICSLIPPGGSGGSGLWLPVIGIAAVSVVSLVIILGRRKKRASNQGADPSCNGAACIGTIPSYKISFPQISEGLPQVWGVGEPLIIRGSGGRHEEITLSVDGIVSRIKMKDGTFEGQVVLQKGDHSISVSGPLGKASTKISIVDYREEIVRTYRRSFKDWMTTMPEIKDATTPREVLQILGTHEGINPLSIRIFILTFEIAEFSDHLIGRTDYERMMFSAMSLRK